MADDPWAQFVKPASGGAPSAAPAAAPPSSASDASDPWAQFAKAPPGSPSPSATAPASSAPVAPQDLGTTALWDKPANVSWGDYMLAHLGSPFKSAYQNFDIQDPQAQDTARVAANTFGLGDRALSTLTGSPLEIERAKTKAAEQRLGPSGTFVANTIGMGPLNLVPGLGELGSGAMLGDALGGGVIARGAGVLGEGAAIGGASAAGRGEPIVPGMAMGAGGSAVGAGASKLVGGALNLGASSGPARKLLGLDPDVAPQTITDAAEAAKTNLYDQTRNILYDSRPLGSRLEAAFDDVKAADPDGDLTPGAAQSFAPMKALQQRAATSQVQSAHSILTALDGLRDAQGPNAGANNVVAPIFERHLNDALSNVTPIANQTGMSASDLLAAAKVANQQFQNAKLLQDSARSLQDFGTKPAGQAQAVAEKYYRGPQYADQYAALQDIANAGQPGSFSPWMLAHAASRAAELGAMGLGVTGHPLGWVGLAGLMGAKAIGGAVEKHRAANAILNSIASSYPALTGRTMQTPMPDFAGALSPATKALMMGGAAYGGGQQGQ
jgi:hypothetical protein